MTKLLEKAIQEAQKLPQELQDELGSQLLEDIESELAWQNTLSTLQPKISKLAQAVLERSKRGKGQQMGFDEL